MPTVMLTARFVDSIKPTTRARVEYCDEDVPGLALRVTPSGAKSWTVRYRLLNGGHQRRLTIGTIDAFTLAQARTAARDALHDASKGKDPASAKRSGRTAETITDLATLYLEKWAKPKKRSWRADRNLLERKVLPVWRHRAIGDIRRRDVLALVQDVAVAGAPVVANRVTALLSKMFAFAVNHELIEASPAMRIPRPGQEQTRDRVLTEDELRTLWSEFEAIEETMAAFYKLRLLTAQRGGEVGAMRWADVDLEFGWWTIPSKSSKNKLAHRVPLNAAALAIVKARRTDVDRVLAARAERGDTTSKPIEYVLDGARGKRQQAEAAATFTVQDFRGHDLRRSAASYMASGGVPRLTISKILNHAERGVTAVYDRHGYDAEKQGALEWWGAKLAAILEPREGAKVLPFGRAS